MTTSAEKLLGLLTEKSIQLDERRWVSVSRLLARMVASWKHVDREARMLLDECRHAPNCMAPVDARHACLPECPDRERYLSARVLVGSAREFVGELELPTHRTGYIPPTREYFDRIVGELEAMRAGRDWIAELGPSPPASEPVAKREVPLTRLVPDDAYPSQVFGDQVEPLEDESLDDNEEEESA